jgi:hypothetical protein
MIQGIKRVSACFYYPQDEAVLAESILDFLIPFIPDDASTTTAIISLLCIIYAIYSIIYARVAETIVILKQYIPPMS